MLSHNETELDIMLGFSEPGEVSTSSSGRDLLVIELKDLRLLRSLISGEIMSIDQFEGMPELTFEMPPIMTNLETVESLQDSTDAIAKITTFLASANLVMALVIGGSM